MFMEAVAGTACGGDAKVVCGVAGIVCMLLMRCRAESTDC